MPFSGVDENESLIDNDFHDHLRNIYQSSIGGNPPLGGRNRCKRCAYKAGEIILDREN
jgi:hypothetical protein